MSPNRDLQIFFFSDILRIEQGSRFVPDYEVAILAKYFNISTDALLEQKEADS